MWMRTMIALAVMAALCACAPPPQSPSEVYLEYQTRSAEGITLDEDMSYWSSAKVAALDDKITSLATRMGKSREEAIEFYLDFSRKTAACSAFEVLEERVEEKDAYLVLESQDVCQPDLVDPSTHKVKLVFEKGWKIDEVEIVL